MVPNAACAIGSNFSSPARRGSSPNHWYQSCKVGCGHGPGGPEDAAEAVGATAAVVFDGANADAGTVAALCIAGCAVAARCAGAEVMSMAPVPAPAPMPARRPAAGNARRVRAGAAVVEAGRAPPKPEKRLPSVSWISAIGSPRPPKGSSEPAEVAGRSSYMVELLPPGSFVGDVIDVSSGRSASSSKIGRACAG